MCELVKKCSKCNELKNISEFVKMKNSPLGVRPDCKKCKYANDKSYRDKNSNIIKSKARLKQKSITEQVKKRKDKKIQELKDKYINLHLGNSIYITKYIGYLKEYTDSKYNRHYFEKKCNICEKKSSLTPTDIEKYIRVGIECNYCKGTIRKNELGEIEKKCPCCENWLNLNDDNFGKSKNRFFGHNYYCKSCKRQKSIKDREDIEFRKREYLQKKARLKTDPLFKLTCNIRSLISSSIKRGYSKKSKKTTEILGCNFEEFKTYIESKFETWMSWEKYGRYNGELNYGWDIDHIIPISSAKTEEDVINLNHYTNFQPLCGYTNRYIKRDKFILEKEDDV
jgi:hypothetical protein